MIAFLLNLIIIAIVMKLFFKLMYPKPPKHFFPKADDDVSMRRCDYCGHELATYRGILQTDITGLDSERIHFFCNHEHQAAFYNGETYRPDENYDGLPVIKKTNDE